MHTIVVVKSNIFGIFCGIWMMQTCLAETLTEKDYKIQATLGVYIKSENAFTIWALLLRLARLLGGHF